MSSTPDSGGELFPAAFPQVSISTTVRHSASGHVLTLTFNDTPLDRVLQLLEGRGLEPVGENTPRAMPSVQATCHNANCTNHGKPLVQGQYGLRCNGKDAVTGNSKGYCRSQG